jgi:hypothetical protein
VPTLFEYSASMSPAFFRATTRLLARPDDVQVRNAIVLRRPDAHSLGVLGVHFVIADSELAEPFRLLMTERTHDDEVFFLYEVPNPNLGTAAPTEVRIVRGFDEAVDQIADIGFDAKRSVLVFDPAVANEKLVPADSAEVRMIPGGFSVEAKSSGTSLITLPFEFSRCLEIHDRRNGVDPPRLLRVNALQTGVLFNKHLMAKIKYFAGLFQNSGCRLRDTQDFSRILESEPIR